MENNSQSDNQNHNIIEQNNNNPNNNQKKPKNKISKKALKLSTVGSSIIAVIIILAIIHFIKVDLIHKKQTKINQELKQAHLNKVISYGGLNYHLLSGISDINNIKVKNNLGQPIKINNIEIKKHNVKKGLIDINVNGIHVPTKLIKKEFRKRGIREKPSFHAALKNSGQNLGANVVFDTVPFNKNRKNKNHKNKSNKNNQFINIKHFNVNLHNLIQINSSFRVSIKKLSANNKNSNNKSLADIKNIVQNKHILSNIYSLKIKVINKGLSSMVHSYMLKNNKMNRIKQEFKKMKQQVIKFYGKNPQKWPLRMHLKYEWIKTFFLNQNKGFVVKLPEQANNQSYYRASFLHNIQVHSIPK